MLPQKNFEKFFIFFLQTALDRASLKQLGETPCIESSLRMRRASTNVSRRTNNAYVAQWPAIVRVALEDP